MNIPIDEFRKIPYLAVDTLKGRPAPLMPFWDGAKWHIWIQNANSLFHFHPADAHESDYVAREPAGNDDLIIPFVDLMWQRAGWSDVASRISAISRDFHNLGTSIEKLDHFFKSRGTIGTSVTHFVKTELEYIFVLSRSIFDLLQEIICTIWETKIRLLDEKAEARHKSRGLPKTFSKMVLKDKKEIRPQENLIAEYALPPGLADAYEKTAPFFLQVRQIRDAIVHWGKDIRTLYDTEKGFCVSKDSPEFSHLPFWKEQHRYNDNLVSLLPLLAYVVNGTIQTCNDLVTALMREIQFPPEIAPGHRIFVRAPHNRGLIWMETVGQGGSPWWSERTQADAPPSAT